MKQIDFLKKTTLPTPKAATISKILTYSKNLCALKTKIGVIVLYKS